MTIITRLYIENYKLFSAFDLPCRPGLNIIVGQNEAGKSTILEAIGLALSKRLNGRPLEMELSPYLFNQDCVSTYLAAVKGEENPEPPRILIELTFEESPVVAAFRGTNSHDGKDECGICLEIRLDEDCRSDYERLIAKPGEMNGLPVEYYKATWSSFADKHLTARGIKVKAAHIDAASLRFQGSASYYMHGAFQEGLPPKDRVALALEYRKLKEEFARQPGISAINDALKDKHSSLSQRDLSIGVDLSQRAPWETNLTPYLDETPLQFAGRGEQHAIKIMFALNRQVDDCHVVLVEEPENHLAFAHMNILVDRIAEKCGERQVFLTTHSAFVLNKLGLKNAVLLREGVPAFLSDLPLETQVYFRKLPGYDTLRLILAKRTILVEGPSDELFVQKAYLQKYGKLPSQNGIDVLSVRGVSFPRFLDIARLLRHRTTVITDNDGDYAKKIAARYAEYAHDPLIDIQSSTDDDKPTLEYHVISVNGRPMLNSVFGKAFEDDDALRSYMVNNKTEWALKAFDHPEPLTVPQYIVDAIA